MDLYEYMTHNRKLKLEEYDDTGKLIDTKEFSKDDLFKFMLEQVNILNPIGISRKKDTDIFTKKELKIINELIIYCHKVRSKEIINKEINWFTETEAMFFREIFDTVQKNELDFIMRLIRESEYSMYTFNASYKSKYFQARLGFWDILQFIHNRDGMYYTVNNKGERIFDFVDRPSKKQVQYQRNKNGNRTVFLNFKDWKVYEVIESELT